PARPPPVTSHQMSAPFARINGIISSAWLVWCRGFQQSKSGDCLQHCRRRFVPDGFDMREADGAQGGAMRRQAAGAIEVVTVQKATASLQQPADSAIAGRDRAHLVQIVDRNGGNRQVEGPTNLLIPFGIAQIAKNVLHLCGPLAETLAGT